MRVGGSHFIVYQDWLLLQLLVRGDRRFSLEEGFRLLISRVEVIDQISKVSGFLALVVFVKVLQDGVTGPEVVLLDVCRLFSGGVVETGLVHTGSL